MVLEQDPGVLAPKLKRAQGPRMTPRDLKTLRWIGEQYAIRFDQLQHLLAVECSEPEKLREVSLLSAKRTREIIRRWEAEELVHYKLFLVNERGWIWLTRRGLQYVGLEARYYEPKPVALLHLYYINQARFYVQDRRPEDRWLSERLLRMQQEAHVKGTLAEHLPDGVLLKSDSSRIAIEVELVAKSKMRLSSILKDLQTNYYRTWYFASVPVVSLLQEVLSTEFTENQRKTIQILSVEERL